MTLKQIQKKYPKAFEAFNKKHKYLFDYLGNDDIRNYWKQITDFMDKQGIILDLEYSDTRGFTTCVTYRIEGEQTYAHSEYYKSRHIAETKGLCKCFEILEERSKK